MKDASQDHVVLPTAAELRQQIAQMKLALVEKRHHAQEVEEQHRREFADDFLHHHMDEADFARMIQLINAATRQFKTEALIYRFPSELCTDKGRAINNGDPDWPETLQGKAKDLYLAYLARARPEGFHLKAMIIDFPHDKPGDVGVFLSWK